MTDKELNKLINEIIEIVADCGPGKKEVLEQAVVKLKNAGIITDMHVGKKDFTTRETLEWYAGGFISIVEKQAWFAMNSWLNCADKFAPKEK